MNTVPHNKTASGPRTKKEETGLNKRSADAPPDTWIKPKHEKSADGGNEVPDIDMTQYQNIDSGKDSSDTERPDNDIEGEDSENIFK